MNTIDSFTEQIYDVFYAHSPTSIRDFLKEAFEQNDSIITRVIIILKPGDKIDINSSFLALELDQGELLIIKEL